MEIIKKSFVIFIVSIFVYQIFDMFFTDIVLYLLGGFFGTVAKGLGITKAFPLIWLVILLGIIWLYFKTSNIFCKIGLIIVIWGLLYLIDIFFYEIKQVFSTTLIIDSQNGLLILLKSFILVCICYIDSK